MSDILNHKALEEAITKTVAEKLSSEAMMKQIEETLEKTVNSAVESALRSFSDVGKEIEKAVKESFQVEDFNLPRYNENVVRIVQGLVAKQTNEMHKHLETQLAEILEPVPEEIKLSEILATFIKEHMDYIDHTGYEHEISFHIEENDRYGWTEVYFDMNSDVSPRDCDVNLTISRNEHSAGTVIGGCGRYLGKFNRQEPCFFGSHAGFDRLLLGMYSAGTKVIIDEDDCDPIITYDHD